MVKVRLYIVFPKRVNRYPVIYGMESLDQTSIPYLLEILAVLILKIVYEDDSFTVYVGLSLHGPVDVLNTIFLLTYFPFLRTFPYLVWQDIVFLDTVGCNQIGTVSQKKSSWAAFRQKI